MAPGGFHCDLFDVIFRVKKLPLTPHDLRGNGSPLQYSGLENSMDCIGHGVAKSQTRLSDFHSVRYLAGGAVLSLESRQSGRNLMYLRKQKEAALIRAESQKELFTGRL